VGGESQAAIRKGCCGEQPSSAPRFFCSQTGLFAILNEQQGKAKAARLLRFLCRAISSYIICSGFNCRSRFTAHLLCILHRSCVNALIFPWPLSQDFVPNFALKLAAHVKINEMALLVFHTGFTLGSCLKSLLKIKLVR